MAIRGPGVSAFWRGVVVARALQDGCFVFGEPPFDHEYMLLFVSP